MVQVTQVTPDELVNQIAAEIKNQFREFTTTGQTKAPEKEVLTRKETAELFDVSLVCIHDWIQKGIIKPYKMGNRTYFKRSEVLESLYNSNRA